MVAILSPEDLTPQRIALFKKLGIEYYVWEYLLEGEWGVY